MKTATGTALKFFAVFSFSLLVTSQAAAEPQNLIRNGDFSEWNGDRPDGWSVRSKGQDLSKDAALQGVAAGSALRVDVVTDKGGSLGEIVQKVRVEPFTRYRFEGTIRSTRKGSAKIQLKLRSGSDEQARVDTAWSNTEWQGVETTFDTDSANEVQVVCRYRQKEDYVNQTSWFTGISLVKVGPSPDAEVKLEAIDQGVQQRRIPTANWGSRPDEKLETVNTLYITPQGSGNRLGGGWDHAAAAGNLTAVQSYLDNAKPGQTIALGSGVYTGNTLVWSNSGVSPLQRITLRGVDTGDGPAIIRGDFDKSNPSKTGYGGVRVQPGVSFIEIAGLQFESLMTPIDLEGRHRSIVIRDVVTRGTRDSVIVEGGATVEEPTAGTQDVLIADCQFIHYTKRAIRIRGGVQLVRLINCHADAGGKEWATERFAMGFTVEGSKLMGVFDHDITYIDCTSRNNYNDNGDEYWNADGFAAERNTYNITYLRCGAFDNTDGGWDLKTVNPVLIDCVSARNKRAYRFWSTGPVYLENCAGVNSFKRGGSGNATGLWVHKRGRAIARNCSFVGNPSGLTVESEDESTGMVELYNCIVSADSPESLVVGISLDQLRQHDTRMAAGDEPGDTGLPVPNVPDDWEGGPEINDSAEPRQGARF
jgi:hypothetical protein